MKRYWNIFYNGIIPSNPVFVLLLGMCATRGLPTFIYFMLKFSQLQ